MLGPDAVSKMTNVIVRDKWSDDYSTRSSSQHTICYFSKIAGPDHVPTWPLSIQAVGFDEVGQLFKICR